MESSQSLVAFIIYDLCLFTILQSQNPANHCAFLNRCNCALGILGQIGLTRLARPLSDCQKPRRNGKYNTLHADLSAISILKYQKYILAYFPTGF